MPALFDHDARQAPRRWSRERFPIGGRKRAFVARTRQRLFIGAVNNGTGQMRTHLRVRVEPSRQIAQQNARIVCRRISKQKRTARRDVCGVGNPLGGRLRRLRVQADEGDQHVGAGEQS